MDCTKLLDGISREYCSILGDNLVGIYVHGSIAFGCFNWNKSDIDFLVVTEDIPTQRQKEDLIDVLLRSNDAAPPKGFEMSVMLEKYCAHFVYPTPFELHFSNTHIQKCRENLKEYCQTMNGTDIDLAAHLTVIKEAGVLLCGKEISEVFGDVLKSDYLDSIKRDVENAPGDVNDNPIYVILNLCRVLAYIREDLVMSKEQGGLWGIRNLPADYFELIQASLACYRSEKNLPVDNEKAQEFCQYMRGRIFAN